MSEIVNQSKALWIVVDQLVEQLDIASLENELRELKTQSTSPDFWQDNIRAQDTMKRINKIEQSILPWRELQTQVKDIIDFAAMDDLSLQADLKIQLADAEHKKDVLKQDLKFNEQYDNYDAILGIYAGAGGTDAQDWAQMLQRMYLRWAEVNKLKTQIIDESSGDEAGIKSVTIDISGKFAYGKLKGEHGVHRLVRLSPFNADNLRQTSFAKVETMPKIDKPEDVIIDEKDLKIDVYRSGGKGGQSVNTTDSAVRITHLPTAISVAIQNERSQLQNKETAMTILRSRLAQLQIEQHTEQLSQLKGPNQSAEWGNQIRSYVLHPYKQVKDLRTKQESSDPDAVLDGKLDEFINAYLDSTIKA